MELDFIINYRLDLPTSPNARHARIVITDKDPRICKDKEEYLLCFCSRLASVSKRIQFYKNVQIMAAFMERPIRVKYLALLPNRVGIFLDTNMKDSELNKKAKELKDNLDIARQENKSGFILKESILLARTSRICVSELEKEYGIRIMTSDEAVEYIKDMMKECRI
jgi:hypothetical protein